MAYAIVASSPGGTDTLRRSEISLEQPGAGQVLIRQTAIGVNFIDVYYRQGLYPWPMASDLILGSEGAGVVVAVGPGIDGFDVGQRVAYTIANGAYASHRLVPAAQLVALPDDISDEVAAAVMLKGLTAYYLIHDSYDAKPGDTVLFHAAAGGVGLIAGQWLQARGVRAIGTAGGAVKCALARAHGYNDVIDYQREDFVSRVKVLTDGAGVAAVYDSVGRDTIMGSVVCLARFGTLVSFGQSSGLPDMFRISDLATGSLRLTRPVLFHYTASRAWLETASVALFDVIRSGKVDIQINATWPLAKAAQAQDALTERKTSGSTILIP